MIAYIHQTIAKSIPQSRQKSTEPEVYCFLIKHTLLHSLLLIIHAMRCRKHLQTTLGQISAVVNTKWHISITRESDYTDLLFWWDTGKQVIRNEVIMPYRRVLQNLAPQAGRCQNFFRRGYRYPNLRYSCIKVG